MTVPTDRTGDNTLPYTVTYEIDDKPTLTWTVPDLWLSDPTAFTIESVDLGGNDVPLTIINVLNVVSNGMGVGYSTIYVVAPDGKSIIGSQEVQDYGTISGIYRVPGRIGCVLLLTKWEEDSEPGRGVGLYAKGHWYVVKDGKLIEYAGLPAIERRLLYRFWDKRLPFWFKDKTTRLLTAVPAGSS